MARLEMKEEDRKPLTIASLAFVSGMVYLYLGWAGIMCILIFSIIISVWPHRSV